MKNVNAKIEKLVADETERIKKKRPFLEDINISYEQNAKGSFFSKLKANTRNKTIFLTQENRCPEAAIRKMFNNLTKLLRKRKYKKSNKIFVNFGEAA